MNASKTLPRSLNIIRWTVRIWSILATAFLLLIFFSADTGGQGPIAPLDLFSLNLTGLALLGLLLAWRQEQKVKQVSLLKVDSE